MDLGVCWQNASNMGHVCGSTDSGFQSACKGRHRTIGSCISFGHFAGLRVDPARDYRRSKQRIVHKRGRKVETADDTVGDITSGLVTP